MGSPIKNNVSRRSRKASAAHQMNSKMLRASSRLSKYDKIQRALYEKNAGYVIQSRKSEPLTPPPGVTS